MDSSETTDNIELYPSDIDTPQGHEQSLRGNQKKIQL